MNLLALLGTTAIGRAILWIAGVALAGGALAFRLIAAGRAQERARQDAQSLEALRSRETTDDEIARTPAADRRERLRRWVRK